MNRCAIALALLLSTPALAGNDDSPETLGAGHMQLESAVAAASWSDAGIESSVMSLNLAVGLLAGLDVVVTFDTLRASHPHGGPPVEGVGDSTLGVKLALWGDGDSATALAVLPFIGFPTLTPGLGREMVECGLIVPFAVAIPWLDLGLQLELDAVDGGGGALAPAGSLKAMVGRSLVGPLSATVELSSSWSAADDLGYELRLVTTVTVKDDLDVELAGGAAREGPFLTAGFVWKK